MSLCARSHWLRAAGDTPLEAANGTRLKRANMAGRTSIISENPVNFAIWIAAVLLSAATVAMMSLRARRVRRRAGLCPRCGAALPNVSSPRCSVCGENI